MVYQRFIRWLLDSELLWKAQLSSINRTSENSKLLLDINHWWRIFKNHIKLLESIVSLDKKLIQAPWEHIPVTRLTEPENGEFLHSIGIPLIPQEYFVETPLFIDDSSMFTKSVFSDTIFANLNADNFLMIYNLSKSILFGRGLILLKLNESWIFINFRMKFTLNLFCNAWFTRAVISFEFVVCECSWR